MNIDELREMLEKENYICFTTDLDWATDYAIEDLLGRFESNHIRPTVFVTHRSEVVERHIKNIEIGIHPNFILPSSHGKAQDEIIDYCMKLVPNAQVFRSHRWYADNDIYEKLWNRGIRYESNICTDMDAMGPFIHRSGMVSFPVFLEDGAYIIKGRSLEFKDVQRNFEKKGLKVINIHPMHYALNTPYFSYTREIKDRLSREEWNNMQSETLVQYSYKGRGIRSFIDNVIEFSQDSSVKIITLKQMYELLS